MANILDDEAKRVLSNPDNLIVSDSLRGRLNFGDEPLPEISIKFCWDKDSISGKFLSYKIDAETDPEQDLAISFNCSEDTLEKFLNINLGVGCIIEILNTKIEGQLFKMSVESHAAELRVTIFVKRYN